MDQQDFLFRLKFLDLRIGGGHSRAELFEQEIEIDIAIPPIDDAVSRDQPELRRDWTHAVAARGIGELVTSVAAGMVVQAIAAATDGVLYNGGERPFRNDAGQRQAIDTILAAVFQREDLLRSRYPEIDLSGHDHDDGPVTIVSRFSPW